MTHTHSGVSATPVHTLISQHPKHTFAGHVTCNDALQHMLLNNIHAAIVSMPQAQNLGMTTRQDLEQLCPTKQALPLAENLSIVTDICTPDCLATDVYNRMKTKGLSYILVVNASGKLLSFLEKSDFAATLML